MLLKYNNNKSSKQFSWLSASWRKKVRVAQKPGGKFTLHFAARFTPDSSLSCSALKGTIVLFALKYNFSKSSCQGGNNCWHVMMWLPTYSQWVICCRLAAALSWILNLLIHVFGVVSIAWRVENVKKYNYKICPRHKFLRTL